MNSTHPLVKDLLGYSERMIDLVKQLQVIHVSPVNVKPVLLKLHSTITGHKISYETRMLLQNPEVNIEVDILNDITKEDEVKALNDANDSYYRLVYLLREYNEMVNDPDAYVEKLRTMSLENVRSLIKTEFEKQEHNKETIRQILELMREKAKSPPDQYDFGFIIENYDRVLIADHWKAVQDLDMISFFRDFEEDSFAFSAAPELIEFGKVVDPKYLHSGCSFGYACRLMRKIATVPWVDFVKSYHDVYMSIIEDVRPHMDNLKIY